MMPGSLSGKVVLVTGAGSRAGHEAALALAARNANLALADLNPLALEETEAEVRQAGAFARAYGDDLQRGIQVQGLIDRLLEDFGRLDGIICCAAARPHQGLLALDEWDWHRTLDTQLTVPWLLAKIASPALRETAGGTLIFSGPDEDPGAPGSAPMSALGRAACTVLAGLVGHELVRDSIRASAVAGAGALDALGLAYMRLPGETDILPFGETCARLFEEQGMGISGATFACRASAPPG